MEENLPWKLTQAPRPAGVPPLPPPFVFPPQANYSWTLLLLDQKFPLMAQRSHVPKFGNWEGENIAYTTYFENARKGKGVGGRILNPNDPEDRHELIREEQHHVPPNNVKSSHTVLPSSTTNTASNKNLYAAEQLHQEKKHRNKEDDAFVGHRRSPYHDNTNAQRSPKDHKSRLPSFGSEESYFSGSSKHSHQNQVQSKDPIRQRHDFQHPMSPQQPMSRTKNNQQAESHRRAASVPKFGAWDVTSPQPGAGFTMIFDKVKEERQNAMNKLPTPLNTPETYSPKQGISDKKPTKPKDCLVFISIMPYLHSMQLCFVAFFQWLADDP